MDYIAPYPHRIFLAVDLLFKVAPHMPGMLNPMTAVKRSAAILKVAIGALIVLDCYYRLSDQFKKVAQIEPSDPFFFRMLAWTSSYLYGSRVGFWIKSVVLSCETAVHVYRLKDDTDSKGQLYPRDKLITCVFFSCVCGIVGSVGYQKWLDTQIFSSTAGKTLSYIRSKQIF